MQIDSQRIHPGERLACAIKLLAGARVVADIGCDHGRLCCSLIQQNESARCIAVDISEPSLKKANRLIRKIGAEDRVETRVGDGLKSIAPGEADALAILGMGGTLMTQILDVHPPLKGAKTCVLQPMRAAEDIRRWLYERDYHVLEDRVALDAGRYYQIFSVGQPEQTRQALPEGWPQDCFIVGYTAYRRREPLLRPLLEQMLETTNRKRKSQRAVVLEKQAAQLEWMLKNWGNEP